MKLYMKALAAMCLMAGSPAFADIVPATPSDDQGILVHGTGPEQIGEVVTGQLGLGGIDVNFDGETTQASGDLLRLQNGKGQADVTGIEMTAGGNPNDVFLITALDIFLDPGNVYQWIELSLYGSGTITFTLTDALGDEFGGFVYTLGSGENKFAFEAIDGQSIANLHFDITGGATAGVTTVKQVRIDPGSGPGGVPEPGTWAMMLLGFAGAGFALRRRRRQTGELLQLA
jgi:hypothetical protein